MKKSDVPQDPGLYLETDILNYAVDEDGRYVPVLSAGWEPATVANRLAVAELERETRDILRQVHAGELSPLAYHMARRRMDKVLLADYAGMRKRDVSRHLTPSGFSRLTDAERQRYAEALAMAADRLGVVPAEYDGGEPVEDA